MYIRNARYPVDGVTPDPHCGEARNSLSPPSPAPASMPSIPSRPGLGNFLAGRSAHGHYLRYSVLSTLPSKDQPNPAHTVLLVLPLYPAACAPDPRVDDLDCSPRDDRRRPLPSSPRTTPSRDTDVISSSYLTHPLLQRSRVDFILS